MGPSYLDEFQMALWTGFRNVVPEPQQRTPLTIYNAPTWLGSLLPFIFMAYLARRKDTHLIRLLLFPLTASGVVAFGYRWQWTSSALNVYNWGQSLLSLVLMGKTLEYAFMSQGVLKVGEVVPQPGPGSSKFPAYIYDAFEVACALRSPQFQSSKGLYIPPSQRPTERGPFLASTAASLLRNFLVLDFFESCVKLFPGVGEPSRGSIFYESLPIPGRYVVSTIIHMFTGTSILAGFGMVYDLLTLIAVGFLDGSPALWPPVLDDPWTADSLHVLWSHRWHQMLRQTFLVFGGYPGKLVAGNLGMLLGAFIASGLFHEVSIYTMGHGFDSKPLLFFAAQGPMLILERVFRTVTGRRVHGRFGTLWVWFMMFILAQPMIDSWHRRGLGSGMVIPPFISPTRLLVTPLYRRFLEYQRSKHLL